jgi:hypothetical protein
MTGDWHKVHGEPEVPFIAPDTGAMKTPLVDLLRRVPDDASAISGIGLHETSYGGVGKTMHEAADLIDELQKRLQEPANTDLPPLKELLTRDQRDALVAANAFLTVLQEFHHDEPYLPNRVQKSINVILGILYK